MSKKRRLLSIITAFAILAALAPWASVSAQASYTGTFNFDNDGKFTVMQITDIQSGTDVPSRVTTAISNAIARYKPDLAVFTGDNVIESIVTESNFRSVINAIVAPLNDTNTKFAVTFGNHDDEGPGAPDKSEQYDYYKSVGGSNFVDHDVSALSGVGSGVIPIYANGQTNGTPAYQVYLMDSGSDPSTGSYDACYTDQVNYYIQNSEMYPDVPSLWFQHVVVPDIYSKCMTTTDNGTGVSFTGSGSFSGSKWYLNTARINWSRSSSASIADIYNEAPAPCTTSLYESSAHRSSASYGSKTLYESWVAYGNLKGAYFGHDHLNEFTLTTADGIDLGYGECSGLYKTLGVYAYNDNNPGVSIYELDIDGTYTNKYVAESDLAVPVIDPSSPTGGTFRVHVVTKKNGITGPFECGTTDDVYIYFFDYENPASNAADYLYKSQDLAGTETGGNLIGNGNSDAWTTLLNVPGPTKEWKSFQIRKASGTDDWNCDYWYLYYTPLGGTEVLLGGYNGSGNDWFTNNPSSEQVNTPWFSQNNHTVTFDGNSADGGSTVTQDIVYGTADFLRPNGFVKTGHSFAGWANTPDGDVSYSDQVKYQMGTAGVTLYAKWIANTYTIGYTGNGSDGGSTADSEHIYDIVKNLTPNGFSRTGYSFAGWATKENGGVEYTDSQSVVNIADSGSVLLYAVWIMDAVTLTAKTDSITVVDETEGLIFGLEPGITPVEFESRFVTILGNGHIDYSTTGLLGTGTKVDLIDNTTGAIIMTYTIIIFGDVNGDGNVDSGDAGTAVDYENYLIKWETPEEAFFMRAGDVNGDGVTDAIDAGIMVDYENYIIDIEQIRA